MSQQSHAHFGEVLHSFYRPPLYWDQRYEFEDKRAMEAGVKNFDWYAPFDKIYPVVESVIDATIKHKILVLGVGKSNIIETLIENGHKDIIAIDISPFIISKMSQKYSYFAGVEFFVLDCRDLSYFSDNTFTLVLDKGCMDCMFCHTNFNTESKKLFSEVYRVLKQNGQFLSTSHATPLSRVPYLRSVRWSIETCGIPEGENLMLYILTKTTNQELIDRKIAGAEAAIKPQSSHVVSTLDQTMNKKSVTRNKANSGSITVTASVESISNLVKECSDKTT